MVRDAAVHPIPPLVCACAGGRREQLICPPAFTIEGGAFTHSRHWPPRAAPRRPRDRAMRARFNDSVYVCSPSPKREDPKKGDPQTNKTNLRDLKGDFEQKGLILLFGSPSGPWNVCVSHPLTYPMPYPSHGFIVCRGFFPKCWKALERCMKVKEHARIVRRVKDNQTY